MKPILRNTILMATMVLAAGLAWAITPREKLADGQVPIDLASMVPTQFGDWTEIPSASTAVIDPGRQQVIERIYTESLSRVYVNKDKYMVMLSIAYGRDQSDGFQLHQPEVCYPAQGFTVNSRSATTLQIAGKPVPTMRLATSGPRPEPLTYWTVVGERNFQGGVAKKLAEMRYGLAGKIPDGMLVRVSSVDSNTDSAYAVQAGFTTQFAAALPDTVRARFMGISAQ